MRMKNALGLIEPIGLATTIEAADAAVKSANIELLGIENSKGDGRYVIKVIGDVGAVKAACEAASAACAKGRGCFSVKVIPRPSEGINPAIFNSLTEGMDLDNPSQREDVKEVWVFEKSSQKKPTVAHKVAVKKAAPEQTSEEKLAE